MINYNELIELFTFTPELKIIKATKYISPKEIVRATRKTYGKKIRHGNIEIHLTIGRPNYAEREFIKLCQKAGEPFPIKKIQLKYCNPKKKLRGKLCRKESL